MPLSAILVWMFVLTVRYHPEFIMRCMQFVHRWPCKVHANPEECNGGLELLIYPIVGILMVFGTVWEYLYVGFIFHDAGRRRERERILGSGAGPLTPARPVRMLRFCWGFIAVVLYLLRTEFKTVWDGLLGSAPSRYSN